MQRIYRLDVNDYATLLWSFCEHFEGSAFISFEGDLSLLDLSAIGETSHLEAWTLERQTLYPKQEFCALPLNQRTLPLLKPRLFRPGLFGPDGNVIHVQMSDGEQLLLSACDNFDTECTVVTEAVPSNLLYNLVASGVVRITDGA